MAIAICYGATRMKSSHILNMSPCNIPIHFYFTTFLISFCTIQVGDRDAHCRHFSVIRPYLTNDQCHPEEGAYEALCEETWRHHMNDRGQIEDDFHLRKVFIVRPCPEFVKIHLFDLFKEIFYSVLNFAGLFPLGEYFYLTACDVP